jgi:class 3 adenylate cyclase
METQEFRTLFHAEAVKGEKAAYFLRWVIVLTVLPGAMLMLATGRYLGAVPYSLGLVGVTVLYNVVLTVLYRKGLLDTPIVKYISVTLDISLITFNHFITSLYGSQLAVATFATILLYPVLLLYATLRHDRRLIVYATLYTIVVFNVAYFVRYPYLDPELVQRVASADPMGQLYKSLYIAVFGFSLLLVPKTIRSLIGRQAELMTQQMEQTIQLKLHEQREAQLVESLYKFVSKEVAEKMLRDPSLLAGRTAHIAALFVDIRGFTSYCATNPPDKILDFLNRFYEEVADAIKRNGGLINKYLGDAVFAIFGAPDDMQEPEVRALQACIDVLTGVDRAYDEFADSFEIDLKIGIGIDSGDALVGNVGSTDRIEYTALGDVVNMASRYEKLKKRSETRLLFSDPVRSAIDGRITDYEIRSLGRHAVRGTNGEREFYTLESIGAQR